MRADRRIALRTHRHALGPRPLDERLQVEPAGPGGLVAQDVLEEPAAHGAGRGLDRLDRRTTRKGLAQEGVVPAAPAVELVEPRQAASRHENRV